MGVLAGQSLTGESRAEVVFGVLGKTLRPLPTLFDPNKHLKNAGKTDSGEELSPLTKRQTKYRNHKR